VCRNQHGVDRLMRGGRVTAAPQDRDLELVHGGHDRAGHERDSARRKVIPEMDAERRVHRGGVQDPIPNHRLGTVRDLLGRLERELHAPREKRRVQPARHLEPDRDMPIVTAGVHLARVLRAVGDVVRFFDRERVHVGADQHAAGLATRRAVPQADHARLTDAGPHRITEPLEPLRHQPAGAPLLEPQLGVLVQVAARGDQARAVDGGESHECRLYDATLYAIRALTT